MQYFNFQCLDNKIYPSVTLPGTRHGFYRERRGWLNSGRWLANVWNPSSLWLCPYPTL